MKTNRPGSILFTLAAALFFSYIVLHGLMIGKIPVLLFRIEYGVASYKSHPLWYVFGLGEWIFLLGLSAVGTWKLWKK